jgi:2-methylcitrate dehydratase PrpD
MGATEDLARFAAEWPARDVPDEILHYGRRCLVNYFSVALYGSLDPSVEILRALFAEEGGNPRATIIGRGGKTSLAQAALANGYLGHVEDYDDTHIPIDYRDNIHPSSPILPAPLAAAEHLHAGGRETLAAGVIGIEVALRVGMCLSGAYRDGARAWHITSTCGILGAAAAAGRILGLSAEQMTHAIGIAATQASGFGEVFGSMCKPFHAGRAAQGGIVAALLAQKGFTSSTKVLEAKRGFLGAMAEDYDLGVITDRLGEDWEIPRVGLKPYACGAGNHALIDAMIRLRQAPGATVDAVATVSGRVRGLADNLVRTRHPENGLQTKFSYFHSMAVAFVDGQAYPAQYTDAKATDPVIYALRDKISMEADPSLPGRSAVVTMQLRDGRSFSERIEHPTGNPQNPMSDGQISEKFRALAAHVLPAEQSSGLLERLWAIDKQPDVADVMRRATFGER